MALVCGDTASLRVLCGGEDPSGEGLAWQWRWTQRQGRCPQTQLDSSLELIKILLNEPASVKVDEVSGGGLGRVFRCEHLGQEETGLLS